MMGEMKMRVMGWVRGTDPNISTIAPLSSLPITYSVVPLHRTSITCFIISGSSSSNHPLILTLYTQYLSSSFEQQSLFFRENAIRTEKAHGLDQYITKQKAIETSYRRFFFYLILFAIA